MLNPFCLIVRYHTAAYPESMAMDIAEIIGDTHVEASYDPDTDVQKLYWTFPSQEIRDVAYNAVDGVFDEGVVMEGVLSAGVVIEQYEVPEEEEVVQ